MEGLLEQAVAWVRAHAAWSGPVVFAASLVESLALVGIVFPGAALMFAAGALAGLGAIPLGPTLLWAAAGAVAGDLLSYWLGRRYGEALAARWPLRRHPELLARGRGFFRRHGGKSVLLGRFVGPLRPVVPAVAGMLGMGAGRFLAIDVAAALAWAPVYVLPGTVFAASLSVAAEVAARLAALLVALLALLWLAAVALRRLTLALQPRAGALLAALARWSRAHRWLGEPGAALADPTHPEFRGLALLALLLAACAWAFAAALALSGAGAGAGPDRALHGLVQALRTPWADRLMAAVTLAGDARVWGAVAAALGLWLAARRDWRALAHWAGGIAGAEALVQALKHATRVPRPLPDAEAWAGYAFPSGHTMMSVAVYGLAAAVVARGLRAERRWLAYVAAGLLALGVGLSRLYLGAHWLTDVLGALALGIAWVAAVAIAWRRHTPPRPVPGAAAVILLALAAAWTALAATGGVARELARWPPPRTPIVTMEAAAWWKGGWARLPALREDLRGGAAQPLTVQWAAPEAEVGRALEAAGWRPAQRLDALGALRYLQPEAPLAELPLPPQVHAGAHERLAWLRVEAGRVWVLRLWDARVRLAAGRVPLWVGYVARLERRSPFGLFAYPATGGGFAPGLARLRADLDAAGLVTRTVRRRPPAPWTGTVLLVRAPQPPQGGTSAWGTPSRSSTRATTKSTRSSTERGP